jgi:hypothetical protein
MSTNTGYIPLSRKIFEHEFWREKRPLSKFEAWIDLIHSARYETSIRTDFINGKPVTWGRGQLIGSVRFLMERWQWKSITKVENYLKYLSNNDMIGIDKGQGVNVVTICKFDDYNPLKDPKKTVKGRGKDAGRTNEGQEKDETNKDNKDNKDNILSTLDDEQKKVWVNFDNWFQEQNFKYVVKIEEQITPEQLFKLLDKAGASKIKDKLTGIENAKDKYTKLKSVYLTLNNWINREQR